MNLPNELFDHPLYTETLPASKETITFKPFLEKERKILLMAVESDDEKEIIRSVKSIIKSCCVTKIDVENLPLIDIEYFFLRLRAKSIGEVIPMYVRCEHINDKAEKCKNKMEFKLDLMSVNVENIKPNRIVELKPNLKVQLCYPPIIESTSDPESIEYIHEILARCIEYIYHGEDIYSNKDYSVESMHYFVENLTPIQFKKLEEFISDQPKLKKVIDMKCSKCGTDHNIIMEGLASFFV
jgi:hypothetical protein